MEFNVQVRNSQFEKSLLNKIARVANSLEREVEQGAKGQFCTDLFSIQGPEWRCSR
jgi:hypothetical protein